jgi:restriction endonuclease S subunit
MKYPVLAKQIEESLGITTVGHFVIAKAKKLLMPLPPLDLQEAFATIVRQLDKSKFTVLRNAKF